jgi:sugar phosphate isomerase/epimerase
MPTNHEPRTANIRLGISSYTYSWAVGVPGYPPPHPLDESGLLDKARQLGVTLLQIGDNLPLDAFDSDRLDRLAKRAAQEKVHLEVGARRLTTDRLAEYAAIARRVGARLLRFVIDDADYHPAPADVTSVLRDAAPLLRDLTLGIENHDRFPAATLRSMIEAAGSDNIGVCLDTANSLGAGEGIAAVAATLAPITVSLHIKDFGIERVPHLMGFTVTGRPAGSGMLNLPALLEQLAPHGRCQTAVLETWPPPDTYLEATLAKESAWAEQSIQYLKPFFALS